MANPTNPGSGGSVPSAQQFADILNAKYPNKRINDPKYPGDNIGDQWLNYYNTHSGSQSLSVLENAFADIILLEDLKGGLTAAGAAVGSVQNAAITGAAKGAIQITSWQKGLEVIGAFFSSLTQASTWLRVGEFIIGAGLIVVGLAHITNTDTALKRTATKVGKAAMIL